MGGERDTNAPMSSNGASAPASKVACSEEMLVKVRHCDNSKMDITLCYQCFGDPQAGNPVILLVCGLNMQLYAWDEAFCEDLVRAGFFVVRYDNRDSGYSTKIEKRGSVVGPRLLLPNSWASALGERLPYTMDDLAKDGLALLKALKIPRAHVLGVSMGGMICQCMALLEPEVVLSITSVMSTTNAPDLPDGQMWVKLWMLRKPPKNCSVDELLDFRVHSLRKLLQHALPVDVTYLKQRYLISLNRSSYGAGLIRQAATVRRCPGRDEALKKMKIPALVIHGAQDLVVPPVHGYRTAQVLPHARLLIFKSMGHYFHPAFFRSIILAFADMASTTAGPGVPLKEAERLLRRRQSVGSASPSPPSSPPPPPGPDAGAEDAEEPCVLTTMASMAQVLLPVVTTPETRTGKAAVKAVNVAVPGTGDPVLPEAVILDLHGDMTTPPTTTAAPTGAAAASPSSADNSTGALPYIVGSPSTWRHAAYPSAAATSAHTDAEDPSKPCHTTSTAASRGPSGRCVPVLAGTPLNVAIERAESCIGSTASGTGTEMTGGRRSRQPSRMHSRHPSTDVLTEGISPAPPLPAYYPGQQQGEDSRCVGEEEAWIDPASTATIEDVAATWLPPLLPGDLKSAQEVLEKAEREEGGAGTDAIETRE